MDADNEKQETVQDEMNGITKSRENKNALRQEMYKYLGNLEADTIK